VSSKIPDETEIFASGQSSDELFQVMSDTKMTSPREHKADQNNVSVSATWNGLFVVEFGLLPIGAVFVCTTGFNGGLRDAVVLLTGGEAFMETDDVDPGIVGDAAVGLVGP
jgi:hypothetical protein